MTNSNQEYRLPDVINIGGMKCGTTSLFHYMRAHPEVGTSRYKQTYFFNDQGEARTEREGNWHKGLEWYKNEWPTAGRVIFEGLSLGYTDWPIEDGIPERIRSVLPDVRFVYMVRNPVEWRWSHARHHTDTIIVGRDPEIVAMRPPGHHAEQNRAMRPRRRPDAPHGHSPLIGVHFPRSARWKARPGGRSMPDSVVPRQRSGSRRRL